MKPKWEQATARSSIDGAFGHIRAMEKKGWELMLSETRKSFRGELFQFMKFRREMK